MNIGYGLMRKPNTPQRAGGVFDCWKFALSGLYFVKLIEKEMENLYEIIKINWVEI